MRIATLADRALPYLYPATFGVAYVLLSFGEFPTPATDLVRPLIVVVAASALLVGLLALPLRSANRASLATSVLVVGLSAPFLLLSVVAAVAVWTAIQVLRGRWRIRSIGAVDSRRLARSGAVFGTAFLVIGFAMAVPAMAGSIFLSPGGAPQAGDEMPNIYVLLLDGYPRTDTLAEVYEYDNTPFVDGLEAAGFTVASGSRSNYPHTWLTLTSMLNGAYLDDLPELNPPPESAEEQYRRLMSALNDAAAVQDLRSSGYQVTSVPSPFHSVALQTADHYLDGGQLTAFEYSLLMHSHLAWPVTHLTPDFLMSQQRDRFHATLASMVSEADHGGGPVFFFAHLFSPPHAPLVYGRDGEHLPLPECVPATCALWEFPPDAWDHLPDQIDYANRQILAAVDSVVAADPTATVILMSDHGSRRDRGSLDEWFHNFFAARTPETQDFPNDISPVNVLRLLSGEAPLPYRAWMFADELRPLDLAPFDPSP